VIGPEQRHVIWMAGVPWDGIRGTDRHLATAMTRYARILWVDPPVSPVTRALRYRSAGRSLRPVLSAIDDQVTRLTPKALPGLARPGVRATTAALVRSQIRWAIHQLHIRPFAVVATHLEGLPGCWDRGVVSVLHGTDDYVAGAELMGLSARHQRRQELRMLARADVVTAVSPHLVRRWAGLGVRPALIPNGCWLTDVSTAAIPPAVRELPRPVVGLIGQLSERIDLDVLEAIADAGFSLLIAGPLDPRWRQQQRFSGLIARPQVHYAGPVPAEAVPSYLAAVDIGVTPYRDTPFNRASFPLKTMEYLGVGLPVVSADLPAARWLRADLARGQYAAAADQILALARHTGEFADAVRRIAPGGPGTQAGRSLAGRGHDQVLAGQRLAFAARHTWACRAEAFASVIGLTRPGAQVS
jgi:teichuronic acid biosynthesis glycosyltransferase TuaH